MNKLPAFCSYNYFVHATDKMLKNHDNKLDYWTGKSDHLFWGIFRGPVFYRDVVCVIVWAYLVLPVVDCNQANKQKIYVRILAKNCSPHLLEFQQEI